MKIEALTCAIGAQLHGVSLADAVRSEDLFTEIKAALLRHKVLFLRDQTFSREDHVAFARRFGELEDHPVAGSDPEHPGLVRIYKTPDAPNDRYENSWHTDATWREVPPMGCVLRCVECPPVGGDTMWANMVLAYERLPEHVKAQIANSTRECAGSSTPVAPAACSSTRISTLSAFSPPSPGAFTAYSSLVPITISGRPSPVRSPTAGVSTIAPCMSESPAAALNVT